MFTFRETMGRMKGSDIEELAGLFGGAPALAGRLRVGVTALYNWRDRGIPYRQRWLILEMAKADGVTLPSWFSETGGHGASDSRSTSSMPHSPNSTAVSRRKTRRNGCPGG